jgi:nitrite reductase/ring-hydroxylating ferredoxin subunit
LRRKKCRRSGRIASALGYAAMSYAAHLGGKLVYEHRVGVDRTDGQVLPDNFVGVLPESELVEDKPTRAMVQGVPILLVRRAGRLFALADTCSHFGGPLSDGTLLGNCIVCPYHASKFDLEDGHVVDGPAVHPQPCLEVRSRDGQIEIRKASIPDS